MSDPQCGLARGPASGNAASHARRDAQNETLAAVAQALADMRYGVIQVTVHDGRAVQLDVTERRRFAS